ncbi:MAG: hypothetical protein ABR597_04880 [Bacteroidales bacterium]
MKIQPKDHTALVLRRKQPFLDWLKDADSKAGSENDYDFAGDYGTYLVEDVSTATEVETFLRNRYKELFENELAEWHDTAFWPEEISYELFCKWFDVEVHRQVYGVG